ncbi:BBSome complex assembly protein BBS10 [Mastacembelus armatus]|uniref:BBSome complex assembly protein BBS10 n=1 Tax=Mastacembelus armatus TaxID=205130 RepID=UPI000E454EBA|nr:Bardet-Biedl syndrome 10 protein [Mastacembelus armatus]
MGMMPVERLHLKHVLQTVCALEAVVLRSFGPEGGQVLFIRDTTEAMLSCSGTRILTALRLEHPVARMVVECVWKHSTATGDGSKTFILLLASLLRMIHTAACKEPNVSCTYNSREAAETAAARRLADKLLAFALEELDDLITMGVIPYGHCVSWKDFTGNIQSPAHTSNHSLQRLLVSFFQTRLGYTHCDFISNLICELLTYWRCKNNPPSLSLQFINDNFPALHTPVSGFPVTCSRLVEGQVIHRDFSTPCSHTDCEPVKAVVFTGCLQSKLLNAGEVLEVGYGKRVVGENSRMERSILEFSAWAERLLERVIAILQSLGISVLLSAAKQSAAVLALARQANICVVECISEDELSLFIQLSGATPVSDCLMIEPEHVATLTFCRPILLGAHRYVHVAFHDLEERARVTPCSLVICGPGEGQTDQYACAFQDAIRMVLTTLEPVGMTATTASKEILQLHKTTSSTPPPLQQCLLESGYVIPAGGTFEFLLHHAMLQHGCESSVCDNTNMDIPAVTQLLAKALLSIPQKIYSHSPRHFLETQTRIFSFILNHSHPFPSLVYKQELNTSAKQSCDTNECPLEENKQSMHCCTKADLSQVLILDFGLESVSCKYQLLLAVLQCVTSLLRVDTVLCTHSASQTKSHRLPDIS